MQQPIDVRRRRHPEGGAVLITVLLVMIALLGMGLTALWLTSGTMQVGANANLRSQALYVAEIGIERARQDMNTRAWSEPIEDALINGYNHAWDQRPTAAAPNNIGVIYRDVANRDYVSVDFPDNTADPSLTNLNINRTGAVPKMGKYTVWIKNDGAEIRMNTANASATADNNDIFVVRSMGVAPDGRTTVVLEVTMGPGSIPVSGPPPSAPTSPVLCNSGKNACDDNSSVQAGVVVQ